MFIAVSLPPWEGMHPLVVHFPVALTLVAPLLAVIGLCLGQGRRGPWLRAAWVVALLAGLSAWAAVLTGEASAEAVERGLDAVRESALETHEELAETFRTVMSIVVALMAVVVFGAPTKERKRLGKSFWPAVVVVGLGYASAAALMVRAASYGGELVHRYGVLAPTAATAPAPAATDRRHEDDDD